MRRSALVLAVALLAALAITGAAATLHVTSARIDSFSRDQAATAPTAAPGFFVAFERSGNNDEELWAYDHELANPQIHPLLNGSSPQGVATTTNRVYVVGGNNRVYEYDHDGSLLRTSATLAANSRGLAVSGDQLWVVFDQSNPMVLRRYSLAGLFGSDAAVKQTLNVTASGAANGLAIDDTTLYILDGGRVLRVGRTASSPAAPAATTLRPQTGTTPIANGRGAEVRDGALWVVVQNRTYHRYDVASLAPNAAVNATVSGSLGASSSLDVRGL